MVVLYCNSSKSPAKCAIDDRTLEEYKIRAVGHPLVFQIFPHMIDILQGSTLHLVLPIRGGGRSLPKMSIGAGGRMKQVVKKDKCLSRWIGTHTTVFNVQILNSAVLPKCHWNTRAILLQRGHIQATRVSFLQYSRRVNWHLGRIRHAQVYFGDRRREGRRDRACSSSDAWEARLHR
jgi:hypothetical protein